MRYNLNRLQSEFVAVPTGAHADQERACRQRADVTRCTVGATIQLAAVVQRWRMTQRLGERGA
jgi:hypothetical protein